jgi:hypothetical protein
VQIRCEDSHWTTVRAAIGDVGTNTVQMCDAYFTGLNLVFNNLHSNVHTSTRTQRLQQSVVLNKHMRTVKQCRNLHMPTYANLGSPALNRVTTCYAYSAVHARALIM